MEVAGFASNGIEAIDLTEELKPDVVTMDINMGKMDGLQAIEQIMYTCPTPIVVVSSYTRKGGRGAMYALELGVIDIVEKPSSNGVTLDLKLQAEEIVQKTRTASKIRVVRNPQSSVDWIKKKRPLVRQQPPETSLSINHSSSPVEIGTPPSIVGIGSSTGGPKALIELLSPIAAPDCPPILIAQHMPPKFTLDFAKQIDDTTDFIAMEADVGMSLEQGHVYVSPGWGHMYVDDSRTLAISHAEPNCLTKPSVDILFLSLAKQFGDACFGVILTGMGNDGAKGALAIRQAGGHVLAQDEETCVVFGMPQAAIKMNAVHQILPLPHIADVLDALSCAATDRDEPKPVGSHQCLPNEVVT